MTERPTRNHSPALKTKVALAAIKGEKTMVECMTVVVCVLVTRVQGHDRS